MCLQYRGLKITLVRGIRVGLPSCLLCLSLISSVDSSLYLLDGCFYKVWIAENIDGGAAIEENPCVWGGVFLDVFEIAGEYCQ